MKKLLGVLLCLSVSLTSFGVSSKAEASEKIVGSPKLAVLVDGRKVKFQGGDPVSEKGRVQVPLRGIGEALGAEIGFSGNTVTYKKGSKSIVLTIGSKVANVDGKSVTMDTTAKAIKGRTYVPLRFVSENLGERVEWDSVANWVWIGSKEVPTIEEADIESVSIEPYSSLYESGKHLMKDAAGKNLEKVYIITTDDLPLKMETGNIFYDIWEVHQGETEGLKVRGSIGDPTIGYLGKNIVPRLRSAYGIEKNADSTKTSLYPIKTKNDIDIDPNSYKSFKLSQIDYIDIKMNYFYGVLLVNPFK
ncbi:copper amine oxidase N-terminal domain-containing protein [Paenibacillus vini]|uniref:copper amine oxidase N-terminal domain-containing protein n=1 Tax=Paenibacillus vini TaxID=1476024 RepID=UPI0025B6809C|nr:copper amine oxidase N-terminal domain-containing protein [Paenibacillus vini]MDN4067577.1 copper amine oxidase N-terminal domain-containing protein [Paenibacillus vini]